MPPEEGVAVCDNEPLAHGILRRSDVVLGIPRSRRSPGDSCIHSNATSETQAEDEVLVDEKGRPYELGPKGFVRDLNTRAVKIARRIVEQSRTARAKAEASAAAAAAAAAAAGGETTDRTEANTFAGVDGPTLERKAPSGDVALHGLHSGKADLGTSGTVRSEIAQEIRFVLDGRLPFVKRWEILVWTWVVVSTYFIIRHGILASGVAPTIGSFVVMYFVLDFYSGVLHVVLDDEWNMKVPLLSQPAMEFQYHHHIPDDGCSRPFVEGMGDLNTIVLLHLVLFTALFIRSGYQDHMLLVSGGWKMLLAYWGIWNHRQAHQLKSKRPRWVTYLQDEGVMLSPESHKAHHTPPHDDHYNLLGVTTWPVTWLGRQGLGSVFWIALFLVLTAFDTVLSARLMNVIFP